MIFLIENLFASLALYSVPKKSVPELNLDNSKNTKRKDKNKVFFESFFVQLLNDLSLAKIEQFL